MLNPNLKNVYRESYSLTFNIVSGRASDGKLIDMRLLLHTRVNSYEEISKTGHHFLI